VSVFSPTFFRSKSLTAGQSPAVLFLPPLCIASQSSSPSFSALSPLPRPLFERSQIRTPVARLIPQALSTECFFRGKIRLFLRGIAIGEEAYGPL